jgi:acetyl-CoA synthetase
MLKESGECEPAVLDSEDLLFMLYTSGSTGNPKGIVHSQAGYLLYGPLANGVTTLLFESTPTYPNPGLD